MAAAAPPGAMDVSIRRNTSAEDSVTVQTVERLVRDTGVLLARAGVDIGRAKVSRIVRNWKGVLSSNGDEYIAYIASRIGLTVRQRAVVADQYRRVISYSDPTGEIATHNVMRGNS